MNIPAKWVEKPFLTVNDLAEILNVSIKWVYLNKKKIPGFLKNETLKIIRFDTQELFKGLKELTSK